VDKSAYTMMADMVRGPAWSAEPLMNISAGL
jgi:hypothetical protein